MAGNKDDSGTCALPISRVKTIMKSSPEVSNITQESLFMITKATELFVKHLARRTLKNSIKQGSEKNVEYSHLSDIVNKEETLQFLQDIIPPKIKYSTYLAMMEKHKGKSTD